MIFQFFCCALTDVGGLLVGYNIGQKPFAEHISPKKTIEGIYGGLLFSVLCALGFYYVNKAYGAELLELLSFWDYMRCGLMWGVSGIIGDLIESFYKRCANIKDTGSYFPEHGGMYDRLDSNIISQFFSYWYLFSYLGIAH